MSAGFSAFEDIFTLYASRRRVRLAQRITMTDDDDDVPVNAAYYVQIALLGKVTPNLRRVGIDWNERAVTIMAFFDGGVSDFERGAMAAVRDEVAQRFGGARTVTLVVERLDAPARPAGYRWELFGRKE